MCSSCLCSFARGHSHIILLRSEIPSGMCTKLRTAAAGNNRDNASQSLLLLLARTTHTYFVLRAHSVRGESHNQCNTTGKVATTSPPFDNQPHRSQVLVWMLNSARPPHPGHSTILLRSEIPSGMCAKLRTVAASNNRDHSRRHR